jgi:hypothetical protein
MRRVSNADGTRAIVPDGDHLLFTRAFPGAILSVPKGGGQVSVVLNDENDPWPLAADHSRIFWATYGIISGSAAGARNPEPTVMSANKDGTDPRRLATLPRGFGSRAIALDDRHLYWIQPAEPPAESRIMRARKDGTEATVLASGQYQPTDLAVDDCSVYWATLGGLDGTGSIRSTPK